MNNISIRQIIISAFVLVSAIGCGFIVATHLMLGSINAASQSQADMEHAVLTLKDIQYHIIQTQKFLSDVSATHNEDGLIEAQAHSTSAKKLLKQLVSELPEFENDINTALLSLVNLEASGIGMANAYIQYGRDAGNNLMRAPVSGFNDQSDNLASHLDKISIKALNKLGDATAATTSVEQHVDKVIIIFSIGMLAIFGFILMLIYKKVLPPVNNLLVSLKEMNNGNGDLTKRISLENNDEVGEIISEFNKFVALLQSMIIEVSSVTNNLGKASEDMSVFTEQTQNGVLQQKHETDQVATAMTEMSATVSEIARNAVSAADATHHANEKSADGKEVVHKTINSIESLAIEVKNAGAVINVLEENSNKIGSILTVIQSIAEQTNLLALNAAIEAARAGEQGRGFAVVADEVRSLATRTHEATQEIQNMIQQLQDGAKNAVNAMHISQEKAETSVSQATTAGIALDEITDIVAQISDMSTQIAAASEEQSAVTEEINRNIAAIICIAEENDKGAANVTGTSKSLTNYSLLLKDIVSKFNT